MAGQGAPRRTTDPALGPQLGQNAMGPARTGAQRACDSLPRRALARALPRPRAARERGHPRPQQGPRARRRPRPGLSPDLRRPGNGRALGRSRGLAPDPGPGPGSPPTSGSPATGQPTDRGSSLPIIQGGLPEDHAKWRRARAPACGPTRGLPRAPGRARAAHRPALLASRAARHSLGKVVRPNKTSPAVLRLRPTHITNDDHRLSRTPTPPPPRRHGL